MTSFTAWGSISLFSATVCAVLFQSVLLWAALYVVGIICFFLAHRQEQMLFERVNQLETVLRTVTARKHKSGEA